MSLDKSSCAACAAMNLKIKLQEADNFFTANDLNTSGFLLANLRTRLSQTQAGPACGLCQFLRSMRNLNGQPENLCLVAFPVTSVLPFVRIPLPTQFRPSQRTVLSLLTEAENQSSPGPLRSADPAKGSRIAFQEAELEPLERSADCIKLCPISSYVDLGRICRWIKFCDDNHSVPCRAGKRETNAQAVSSRVSSLRGFHLIDVVDRVVVPSALSEKFVALSYVWGGYAKQQTATLRWPKVVEDAIVVTAALGFHYLWVDRYCIPEEDKHNQISRMDLIYQKSQLTIIAAAGQDADHGLPGVTAARASAPTYPSPLRLRVMPPHDARDAIRQSMWWARGWTYQEGVLSRRRLVFTKHEVYYECNAMFCYEGLRLNLAKLHEAGSKWFRDFLTPGLLDGRPHFNPIHQLNLRGSSAHVWTYISHLRILQRHISEYSSRLLTYKTDKLNAFRGILSSHDFPTYYGLPVVQSLDYDNIVVLLPTRRITLSSVDFVSTVCGWSHIHSNPSASDAYDRLPPIIKRVDIFPSWSWTGWTGLVDFSLWNGVYTSRVDNRTGGLNTGGTFELFRRDDGAQLIRDKIVSWGLVGTQESPSEEPMESLDLSNSLSCFIAVSGSVIFWPRSMTLGIPDEENSGVDSHGLGASMVGTIGPSWRVAFYLSIAPEAADPEAFLQSLWLGEVQVMRARTLLMREGDARDGSHCELGLVLRRTNERVAWWGLQGTNRQDEVVWERLGVCYLKRQVNCLEEGIRYSVDLGHRFGIGAKGLRLGEHLRYVVG